jgi:putative transposase
MRMREIAQTRVCYGYRKIRVLLNREGWNVGKDLVYRLYKEEGLVRLKSHDSWMKIIFFIRTNESLEGKTPMEALRLGMIEEVAQVARVFGEQDAV